jgi:uncharacterized protein (TIGR04552 family)
MTDEGEVLELDLSTARHVPELEFTLQDLEATNLLLRGNSIVDWHKLDLADYDAANQFLRLHLLDIEDPLDRERLRFVFNEAINYLEEHLGLHFPDELRDPADVRDLFIWASQYGGFRRKQVLSCVILKLMHVINHMEAADLKFQTSVSEARLMDLAEQRIITRAEEMRRNNLPIVAFYGSRKTRNSTITKLLAKRESIAATVFDKLRFRLVTETKKDVLPAIAWLMREVFPFNHVIPGQSHNNLLTLSHLVGLQKSEKVEALFEQLHQPPRTTESLLAEDNPFSGSSYSIINFIVDYPVRIDEFLKDRNPRHSFLLGRTVYVLVEFQVLDGETSRANEEGENAHYLYKSRQREIVERRLKRGGRRRSLD